MVVSWPKGIKPDKTPRVAVPPRQRHRADALRGDRHQAAEGSQRVQAGPDGRREHGVHLRRREGAGRARRPSTSRTTPAAAIYHDGWFACDLRAVRPVGHAEHAAHLKNGTRTRTCGSSTTSRRTSPQADDLAAKEPERLAKMKKLFLAEAKANKALSHRRRALDSASIPRTSSPAPTQSWRFDATTTRMPEFTAPGLGQAEQPRHDRRRGRRRTPPACSTPSAARAAGSRCYMDKGQLVYEYNMLIIERTIARSASEDRAGQAHDRGRRRRCERQAAAPGRRRPQGRRSGSRAHDGEADGACGVHRERDVRRRRRSRLDRLARLLRPRPSSSTARSAV